MCEPCHKRKRINSNWDIDVKQNFILTCYLYRQNILLQYLPTYAADCVMKDAYGLHVNLRT
jgi:hypothetical protein